MSAKSGQPFRMNDGDWICDDQNCLNVNFARRMNCNLCGREKPFDGKQSQKDKKRKAGHEIGKAAAEKSKGLFSADDWQCGRCGNVNWARRNTCNMCSAPKFGDNEQRTGLGGGYNEREDNIEYIEREESDSEYDDFGRRKKKMKKYDNNSSEDSNSYHKKDYSSGNSSKHKSNDKHNDKHNDKYNDNKSDDKYDDHKHRKSVHNSRDKKCDHKSVVTDDKEDVSKHKLSSDSDDEDEDISKYKLTSDEEEGEDISKYKLSSDDDDDDDDEDVSKYDLTDLVSDDKSS